MSEIQKSSLSSKIVAATADDFSPSRFSGAIFFLLAAMLVLAVAFFGAVDVWALGAGSIFAGLIAVFWLAEAYLKKEFRFDSSSLQIPLLALILIGAVQLLPLGGAEISSDLLSAPAVKSLSLAPYATRLAVIQLIVYFVFFAAALAFVNTYKRLQIIVSTIVIFGAAWAVFGILQRFAGAEFIYGLRSPGQAFFFASFVNQHHFAAFMEMTIGLTLGLLFGKATKSNKIIFLLAATFVMGTALIFTSSRGGMISLLAVIGFVVAANVLKKPHGKFEPEAAESGNWRRNLAYVGSGLLLVAALLGAVLMLGGDESLLRGAGLANQTDVSNGRFHFWLVAWRIFLDHPILGAGLDAFGTVFPQYDAWNGMYRIEQAHNDYLQILADAGIFGFAAVVAFIFLLFKKGFAVVGAPASDRLRRGAATGALAGCFGVLVHSFFDFPLRTPSNALFFLTLAVVATTSIAAPKVSRRRSPH